jgi:hypothetical protein
MISGNKSRNSSCIVIYDSTLSRGCFILNSRLFFCTILYWHKRIHKIFNWKKYALKSSLDNSFTPGDQYLLFHLLSLGSKVKEPIAEKMWKCLEEWNILNLSRYSTMIEVDLKKKKNIFQIFEMECAADYLFSILDISDFWRRKNCGILFNGPYLSDKVNEIIEKRMIIFNDIKSVGFIKWCGKSFRDQCKEIR